MQLLCLGSSQLLDKVDCHDVLMLGTRVAISDTARDLISVLSSTVSCRWQPTSRPPAQFWPMSIVAKVAHLSYC